MNPVDHRLDPHGNPWALSVQRNHMVEIQSVRTGNSALIALAVWASWPHRLADELLENPPNQACL